jgi:hypothetical protein
VNHLGRLSLAALPVAMGNAVAEQARFLNIVQER